MSNQTVLLLSHYDPEAEGNECKPLAVVIGSSFNDALEKIKTVAKDEFQKLEDREGRDPAEFKLNEFTKNMNDHQPIEVGDVLGWFTIIAVDNGVDCDDHFEVTEVATLVM